MPLCTRHGMGGQDSLPRPSTFLSAFPSVTRLPAFSSESRGRAWTPVQIHPDQGTNVHV